MSDSNPYRNDHVCNNNVKPQVGVIFISFMEKNYSRTGTYASSRVAEDKDSYFARISYSRKIRDLVSLKNQFKHSRNKIVVASPSQALTLFAAIIFRKRPNLDAGWSLFEASRNCSSGKMKTIQVRVKSYLVDFIASHIASVVIVESNHQKQWYCKVFLLKKAKVKVVYTGLNEKDFQLPGQRNDRKVDAPLRVIFRGKPNPEAGLELLAEVVDVLSTENFEFLVLAPGYKGELKSSPKTTVYTQFFNDKKEIANFYIQSDLSLGQLSSDPRLHRTIPHKAFESAFLAIPYLSARNKGISEIAEANEVFFFEPGSVDELVSKLRFLERNRDFLIANGENFHRKYLKVLHQEFLSAQFFELLL